VLVGRQELVECLLVVRNWLIGVGESLPRLALNQGLNSRGSEAGSYLRLIDSCITLLEAQGPSRIINVSKEEEEKKKRKELTGPGSGSRPQPRARVNKTLTLLSAKMTTFNK